MNKLYWKFFIASAKNLLKLKSPLHIQNSEELAREIYDKRWIQKKTNSVTVETFRPNYKAGHDRVSLNRIDFFNSKELTNLLKEHGKRRTPSLKGLAIILKSSVDGIKGTWIKATPFDGDGNPFHADLFFDNSLPPDDLLNALRKIAEQTTLRRSGLET